MNFRPNKWKVILSVIITLVVFWVPLFFINVGNAELPSLIRNFLNLINLSKPLSNIPLFIIELVFVYLIFSLFQKKK